MIAVIDAQLAWCPPTFSPSAAVADMVGVVDRPRRQQAQPLVEDLERGESRSASAGLSMTCPSASWRRCKSRGARASAPASIRHVGIWRQCSSASVAGVVGMTASSACAAYAPVSVAAAVAIRRAGAMRPHRHRSQRRPRFAARRPPRRAHPPVPRRDAVRRRATTVVRVRNLSPIGRAGRRSAALPAGRDRDPAAARHARGRGHGDVGGGGPRRASRFVGPVAVGGVVPIKRVARPLRRRPAHRSRRARDVEH